jgi:hypothetical protein
MITGAMPITSQETIMKLRTALIVAIPLALAGCGSSDNASTEAEADTVEIPANEALEGVNAAPVADPNANATLPVGEATPTQTEEERIQAAGDSAADTAAAAADAMDETATTTEEEAQR